MDSDMKPQKEDKLSWLASDTMTPWPAFQITGYCRCRLHTTTTRHNEHATIRNRISFSSRYWIFLNIDRILFTWHSLRTFVGVRSVQNLSFSPLIATAVRFSSTCEGPMTKSYLYYVSTCFQSSSTSGVLNEMELYSVPPSWIVLVLVLPTVHLRWYALSHSM